MKRYLEWLLAFSGAAICIGTAAIFWTSQSGQMWPLPGAHLITIEAFGVLGLVSVAADHSAARRRWGAILWIVVGGLVAFVVLGAWTVGFFLIPAALAFGAAAGLADARRKRALLPHLGLALLASLIEAGIILGALWLTAPGAL